MPNVKGFKEDLSGGRLVFLGKSEENRTDWYLRFVNSEGSETKLKLSDEAMSVLVALHKRFQRDGLMTDDYGFWRQVDENITCE